jgi:hypothetical protein
LLEKLSSGWLEKIISQHLSEKKVFLFESDLIATD